MTMTLEIPDDVWLDLKSQSDDFHREALEAVAEDGYVKGRVSMDQVRRMLGLESKWDAQALLSQRGVWPGTTLEEFEADCATLTEFKEDCATLQS
jgi:hypothetical protein